MRGIPLFLFSWLRKSPFQSMTKPKCSFVIEDSEKKMIFLFLCFSSWFKSDISFCSHKVSSLFVISASKFQKMSKCNLKDIFLVCFFWIKNSNVLKSNALCSHVKVKWTLKSNAFCHQRFVGWDMGVVVWWHFLIYMLFL